LWESIERQLTAVAKWAQQDINVSFETHCVLCLTQSLQADELCTNNEKRNNTAGYTTENRKKNDKRTTKRNQQRCKTVRKTC